MIEHSYCIIMTTYANDEIGKKIINSLITKNLAACIQVQEVNSYYKWKGNVNNDSEKLLYIKTKHSLYSEVEKDILSNHDYETPEIIEIPINTGFANYLNWIEDECKQS